MRALLLTEPGSLEHLQEGDLLLPEPGAGEVRVRVHAVGLNPVDCWLALGDGHPDWTWPHVLGLDVAGVIDAIGVGVTGIAVGDRVANHGDLRRQGALAEFVVVSAQTLAPIPDAVSWAAAAALPCAGMTAYQAVVRRLHVQAGDDVLVTAAAGGVGGFAVQLASAAGARVIGTASAANRDRVRALGAAEVIDYRTDDVAARVRELTGGRGVDGVVDTLSAESATAALGLLAHGGGVVGVSGRPDAGVVEPFTIAPSVHEIALGAAHSHGDDRSRARLSDDLSTLLGMVAAGRLDPMVSQTVTLAEAPAALAAIAGRHVSGKLVVELVDDH